MAETGNLDTIGGRVRWAITKFLGISQAEAARRLKIKPSQVSRWVNNPELPPSEESLGRIAQLTGVPQAWLRYGGDLDAVEAGVFTPEPQHPLDAGRLHALPRQRFNEFMGELFTAGCDPDTMERAGRVLLAPIAEAGVATEAAQLAVLEALIPLARQIAGAPPNPDPTSESGSEEASTVPASGETGGAKFQERAALAKQQREQRRSG